MPNSASAKTRFPEVEKLPVQTNLPNPLVTFAGKEVKSERAWKKRREELKELFQHYMYGYFPPAPPKVQYKLEQVDRNYFGGKATKKQITIALGPRDWPKIQVLLLVPNNTPARPAVFVGVNFCGNHQLLNDPTIPLPQVWMPKNCAGCSNNVATEAGRGAQVDVWALEQTIDRGYAIATFYHGDLDPDKPDFSDGVHPHFMKVGQKERGAHDWGSIAAWAWGFHRVVDYLQEERLVDRNRIAVVGHSRNGKTALLAAAFDERIAMAIPLQAGCGGTAPSRGKIGESVKQINTSFPHWFNGEFKKFNTQPERLPFDQHSLTALMAPRPVLFANAVEDTWANPAGQFEVLQGADPVYRLLGVEGLAATSMPEPGKLVDSRLGYYIRPGKHSMTRDDWKVFLDYADKHLKKQKTK